MSANPTPPVAHAITYGDLFAQVDAANREIAAAEARIERWRGVKACAEALIVAMRSPPLPAAPPAPESKP
jgi:hypothetical protein